MPRTSGAKNVTALEARTIVSTTTATSDPAKAAAGQSPLEQFLSLLRHQENFLKWIESRHEALSSLSNNSTSRKPGPKGPKSATFRKYQRYVQQLALLEAV